MADEVKSDTVWNAQILGGFINLIHSVVGSDVKVQIRKPDEDFKVETYPSAILQVLYQKFSVDRYYKDEIYLVSKDMSTYKGVEDNPPLTYDIAVQVDFFAKLQSDIDSMVIKWLSYQRRDFNLSVNTVGGESTDVHVMPVSNARRLDEVNGNERIFRSCFNYKVYGRIEEHTGRTEVPLVKTLIFNTKGMKK